MEYLVTYYLAYFSLITFFMIQNIFYLFQVDDKYSSEGRWHETVDEKIDAGIDRDEKMRNGHPDQGPKGDPKAPIFNGGSDNLECE